MTIELSPPNSAIKPNASHANGGKNKVNSGPDAAENRTSFNDVLSNLDESTSDSEHTGKTATAESMPDPTMLSVQAGNPSPAVAEEAAKIYSLSQKTEPKPAEAAGLPTSGSTAARRSSGAALIGEKPEGNAKQGASMDAARQGKVAMDDIAKDAQLNVDTQEVDTNAQQGKVHEFKETLIRNLIQSAMREKEGQPLPVLGPVREKLAEEHSIFKSKVTDPLPSSPNVWASGGVETSIPTVDGAVGVDNFVAEQVSYWISQDIQNAEMKLDGLGMEPVDVSIRLQGNEATVSFATDELQARTALEGASAHLKDMLERQGMILLGMSVGGHGADGSSQQDRKPRQGAQIGTVQVSKMQQMAPAGVRGTVQGSSLDLYV